MIFFEEVKMGHSICYVTYTADGKTYNEILKKSEIAEFDGYEFVSILGCYYIADVLDLKRDTITLKEFDNYYNTISKLNWDGICQKIHAKIYESGRLHPLFSDILNNLK